jgi:tryptophan synthase alpha chain
VANPIDELFGRLRSAGRKAFIPFLTAGDPDLDTTVALGQAVARAGASLVEIGFPYSDPIADGPVIQASYTRALDRGLRLAEVLATVDRLARLEEFCGGKVPLVAMASYTLVQRRGEAFWDEAQAAGLSGAIVPDLPLEESAGPAEQAARRDFKLIHLVTPTTPRDRALAIAQRSTGFLYCVSITGITGERAQLPAELLEQLAWLRQQTALPLCVGFGISRPEHVRMLRDAADGVIVGSALMRRVEQAASRPGSKVVGEVADLVRELSAALG